ncbi:uncharacterized protein V6R79_006935 [Siganus canaliculatus]
MWSGGEARRGAKADTECAGTFEKETEQEEQRGTEEEDEEEEEEEEGEDVVGYERKDPKPQHIIGSSICKYFPTPAFGLRRKTPKQLRF